MEVPSVRVLVVGDSGVGKTALLRAACRDPSDARDAGAPQWTTGCDVHVLLHQYREGYNAERDVFIEFIDVGGHPKYEISRAVFYHDIQGIIFVHDLSNARSYDHLKTWSSELAQCQRSKGCVLSPSFAPARPGEYASLHSVPKLVIGNKRDRVKPSAKRPTVLPELRHIESIEVSAEPFALDPTVFHNFLDRVVAFANTSASTASSEFSNGYASPFADGLRQVKSKPSSSSSFFTTPLSSSGNSTSARDLWR